MPVHDWIKSKLFKHAQGPRLPWVDFSAQKEDVKQSVFDPGESVSKREFVKTVFSQFIKTRH